MIKNWRLRAIAEERERLALQIHDTLAQSFAGIGYQLQAIRNTIPEGNEIFEQRVDLAMSMARNSHEEARRCIANLRPESLEQVVLLPALRGYAELMVKNGAVKIEVLPGSDGRGLPPRVRDALFRIGKEAIANAVRHANSRRFASS
jgi:signal transduction histidine kinase